MLPSFLPQILPCFCHCVSFPLLLLLFLFSRPPKNEQLWALTEFLAINEEREERKKKGEEGDRTGRGDYRITTRVKCKHTEWDQKYVMYLFTVRPSFDLNKKRENNKEKRVNKERT